MVRYDPDEKTRHRRSFAIEVGGGALVIDRRLVVPFTLRVLACGEQSL